MLKPDPQVVANAIATDPIIISLHAEIQRHKNDEHTRIGLANAEIKSQWSAIRELKNERRKLNRKINTATKKVKHLERKRKLKRGPIKTMQRRIVLRSRFITKREEEKFLHEQRLAFRKLIP